MTYDLKIINGQVFDGEGGEPVATNVAVKDGVIDYLLPRMERSVSAARSLVEMLDKRALVKKTPITRAVAREVLAMMQENDETWPEDPADGEPE